MRLALNATCLLLLLCNGVVVSQENTPASPPATLTTYTSEQLHKYFSSSTAEYEMKVGGKKLTVSDKPILNWQNSARMDEQGEFVSWSDGKRPMAVGTVFTYVIRAQVYPKHELIWLGDKPIEATINGELVWSPKGSATVRKPIPKVEAPFDAAPRRLTQMRQIVSRFSAELIDPSGKVVQLSSLPRPLIRYDAPSDKIIDGAVFAFVVGTDPEMLLILEAVERNGKTEWTYCLIRCHYWTIQAKLDNEKIWSADLQLVMERMRQGQQPEASLPYVSFVPKRSIPAPSELKD